VKSLLETRFRMVAHIVKKEKEGYALTIAKGGFKLKESKPGDPPPPLPEWARDSSVEGWEGKIAATMPEANIVVLTARRISVPQLIETLQRLTQLMVWDQTSLPGNYYFAFR